MSSTTPHISFSVPPLKETVDDFIKKQHSPTTLVFKSVLIPTPIGYINGFIVIDKLNTFIIAEKSQHFSNKNEQSSSDSKNDFVIVFACNNYHGAISDAVISSNLPLRLYLMNAQGRIVYCVGVNETQNQLDSSCLLEQCYSYSIKTSVNEVVTGLSVTRSHFVMGFQRGLRLYKLKNEYERVFDHLMDIECTVTNSNCVALSHQHIIVVTQDKSKKPDQVAQYSLLRFIGNDCGYIKIYDISTTKMVAHISASMTSPITYVVWNGSGDMFAVADKSDGTKSEETTQLIYVFNRGQTSTTIHRSLRFIPFDSKHTGEYQFIQDGPTTLLIKPPNKIQSCSELGKGDKDMYCFWVVLDDGYIHSIVIKFNEKQMN
ncbi:Uncharacterized protein QTN25_000733 [Entamoeba marina]